MGRVGAPIEVLNLDRLTKKLERLSKVDLEEPMKKSAYLVENNAKRFAPVDTGRLRNEIKNRVTRSRDSIEAKIGHFDPMLEYAPFLEWGTSKNPQGHPFLRPGLAYSKQPIQEEFNSYVKREISKIRK